MSQSDIYTILDECVARLRQGEPLETCLSDYPEQAKELAPALTLTADLIQLSPLEPAPEIVAHGYEEMMALFEAGKRPSFLPGLFLFIEGLTSLLRRREPGLARFLLRLAMIVVVLLVIGGSFVVTVAAGSLPGDALYPVKRSWENIRLTLTLDEAARQELETELEENRREEVQAILNLHKQAVVGFKGLLQSMTTDVWLVDGLEVRVTEDTAVDKTIVIGQKVSVRAQVLADGTLVGLEIVGFDNSPAETAVPLATPLPTDTPSPTDTPRPTYTPTSASPEHTPEPEPTHRPTERPTEPTRTPASTHEPTPTREPDREPTSTLAPTIDGPSDVPTATTDQRPKDTPSPEPSPTSRPDKKPPDPTPTSEPAPEPTSDHPPTPTRDHVPTPTPTRHSDSGDGADQPP